MSSDQELLTLLNNRISKTTKLIKEKQADALGTWRNEGSYANYGRGKRNCRTTRAT